MKNLAFWTVYCGPDNGCGCLVPPKPSNDFDCFFFSNNTNLENKANEIGYIFVYMYIPIKDDIYLDTSNCRIPKILSHNIKELEEYEYNCYYDTKRKIDVDIVKTFIFNNTSDDVCFAVRKHSVLFNVYEDFTISMHQDRYRKDCIEYSKMLNDYCNVPNIRTSKDHLEACLIIRKNCKNCEVINDYWYKLTQKYAIPMDQLSLAIVFHTFRTNFNILPVDTVISNW